MGQFVRGDVLVLPFPFSDLSGHKLRPVMVLARLTGDDTIVCMITSRARYDGYSVEYELGDFDEGSLPGPGHIRPNRVFTADETIVHHRAGHLREDKVRATVDRAIEILRA